MSAISAISVISAACAIIIIMNGHRGTSVCHRCRHHHQCHLIATMMAIDITLADDDDIDGTDGTDAIA
eukprot:9190387-Karenia_brevis.AAC.1